MDQSHEPRTSRCPDVDPVDVIALTMMDDFGPAAARDHLAMIRSTSQSIDVGLDPSATQFDDGDGAAAGEASGPLVGGTEIGSAPGCGSERAPRAHEQGMGGNRKRGASCVGDGGARTDAAREALSASRRGGASRWRGHDGGPGAIRRKGCVDRSDLHRFEIRIDGTAANLDGTRVEACR